MEKWKQLLAVLVVLQLNLQRAEKKLETCATRQGEDRFWVGRDTAGRDFGSVASADRIGNWQGKFAEKKSNNDKRGEQPKQKRGHTGLHFYHHSFTKRIRSKKGTTHDIKNQGLESKLHFGKLDLHRGRRRRPVGDARLASVNGSLRGMSTSDSTSVQSRRTRGVTRLPEATSRQVPGQRRHLEIDPRTDVASGLNADRFSSYLGKIAKTHVSILHATWDDVPEDEKNLLWQDVQLKYDVPNTLE
ncbi:uncharacterized protein LOC106755482 [Vigna radiata var. radiata]|uniref:Uncharacterized protein LOC106755482 n=1 Tax=Vigna radiata var. radiata TaxID=3916 RepID=A0A3Q0EUA5_VIGRR|nr:uncharacterized protein LOC106755482 [Vigna radiata var. radiata]